MNNNETFGVLLCNHNRAEYIGQAIESVINQSYTNWKLYILDDASEDNSIEIIKRYTDHEKIVFLTNKTNKGVGYCKKKLIDGSEENIVGFLDSDDVLDPTTIEECVQKHQENPDASIVYTNHYICDENLKIIRQGDSRKIPKGESHATFFGVSLFASFKRKHLNLIEGIRENLPKAVDQDLYFQLEEVGSLVYIDQCLYKYRHNSHSISLGKNYKKAGMYRIQLLRELQQRRKNTKIPFPSKLLINFRERQLLNYGKSKRNLYLPKDSKHWLELINFILYQIKVKSKLFFTNP